MRTRGQTFLGYVRELHIRLADGTFGRNILKFSGIAMLLSLGSGLYLWWPIKQVRIRGKWGTRRLWFDLHSVVGIFSLLPLAILAATGTIIGFEDQLGPLIYKLTRSSPINIARSAPPQPVPGATAMTPDEAVAIACAHMPGAIPYRVQMPKYGGLYVVALLNPRDRVAGDGNVVAWTHTMDTWCRSVGRATCRVAIGFWRQTKQFIPEIFWERRVGSRSG